MSKEMIKRPGFLVYYDIMNSLDEFSAEDTGVFIWAMCNYSRDGTLPEFEDRGLLSLWRIAQSNLDRDCK